MKQTLFLMLGYPGSGKSYFAKQLAARDDIARLSADSIRKNMFDNPREHMNPEDDRHISNVLNYVTREILSVGQSVIYDANKEQRRERHSVYEIAEKLGVAYVAVWVKTPVDDAMQRSGPPELTTEYVTGYKNMIQEYADQFEEPKADEPCIVIDGTAEFEDQLADFRRALGILEAGQ